MVSGTCVMFNKQTKNALNIYQLHIPGVTFDVNFPIAFIPPMTVNQVIMATLVPINQPLL